MSLNHIELHPNILAGLYANNLVVINTTPVVANTTSVPDSAAPKFLGMNAKKILVVVTGDESPIIPDKDLEFLTSILTACQLHIADTVIINFGKMSAGDFDKFLQQSESVLLFGVDPLSIGLPIHFPYFQIQPFNKRTYLFSPPLDVLGNDKKLKTSLWNALKKIFSI